MCHWLDQSAILVHINQHIIFQQPHPNYSFKEAHLGLSLLLQEMEQVTQIQILD